MVFTVYVRHGCCFCHNLLRALELIKNEYELEYNVEEAGDDEAVPYIQYVDQNNMVKKLVGFHEKNTVLKFLGKNEKTNGDSTKTSRKILRKFV